MVTGIQGVLQDISKNIFITWINNSGSGFYCFTFNVTFIQLDLGNDFFVKKKKDILGVFQNTTYSM